MPSTLPTYLDAHTHNVESASFAQQVWYVCMSGRCRRVAHTASFHTSKFQILNFQPLQPHTLGETDVCYQQYAHILLDVTARHQCSAVLQNIHAMYD